MSKKDPATLRLRILLETLADHAGSESCALFMPRQFGLGLVAHTHVDQLTLDVVNGVWVRNQEKLEEGSTVAFGSALVWPLFDNRKLVGVLFLDKAAPTFAEDEDARTCVGEIVARLRRIVPPTLFNNYLAIGLTLIDARREAERDQLIMALRVAGGKIRATARLLRVTRETIYQRAAKFEIDLDAFKATD